MKQPKYVTLRTVLIQLLDDNNHPDIVNWIKKGSTFNLSSWEELCNKWKELARPTKRNQPEYGNQIRCDIHSSFMSSVLEAENDPRKHYILTRSIPKRNVINDLKPGNLYEFILRLLLERTRIDWLDWKDKEQLEFRINTRVGMKKMGDEYVKVNNIKTNNSVYYMRLMLTSLCTTGILIKSQRSKYGYKFNKEWYEKEVKREVDGEDDPNKYTRISEQVVLSWIHYPKQTIHDELPCCRLGHPGDAPHF